MPGRIQFQVARGTKANMPMLSVGEFYWATDEQQLYIGSSLGNLTVLLSTVGTGNGPMGQSLTTRKKGTGGGPTKPTVVVSYAKLIVNGTTYWVPLTQ